MGQACRVLGDEDGAQMELDAARWVFRQLGAVPDLAHIEALVRPASGCRTGRSHDARTGSTPTCRYRPDQPGHRHDLFLSEKTVARHVSNIFTKLNLSSRAAATAYAYEHDLV